MIPGFFLFQAASAVGPRAPVTLQTNIAANAATAFLVILAMTFGLILPRILVEDRSCNGASSKSRTSAAIMYPKAQEIAQAGVRNSEKA